MNYLKLKMPDYWIHQTLKNWTVLAAGVVTGWVIGWVITAREKLREGWPTLSPQDLSRHY